MIIEFSDYDYRSIKKVKIPAHRIVSWQEWGRQGSAIRLDDGTSRLVGDTPGEIEKKVNYALLQGNLK